MEKGHRVDLVVASAGGVYQSEIPNGVRLVDLGSRRQIPLVLKLRDYLRSSEPDALLATPYRFNLTAVWAGFLARGKTRIGVREATFFPAKLRDARSRRHLLKKRVISLLARPTYSAADSIIAVSGGVSAALAEHFRIPEGRISVISNPIDVERTRQLAREGPGLSEDSPQSPLIVAAGRLTEQKDFQMLVRAFHRIVQELPRARLCILGEGPLRADLESQITAAGLDERVLLPGFLRNPFPVLASGSCFALSSRWEGFPNVLLQALALGKPIVATDCPSGPSEILGGGRWGRLVPVGDDVSLAGGIVEAVSRPSQHDRLVARAREFDVDSITDLYLEALQLQ